MQIDGHTRLAFLLGYPVGHSRSPAMQQAAFRATDLNAVYLPWAVSPAHLRGAVSGLRAMENLLGANVTVPHKEAVVPLLDRLTPDAEAAGAVNTIVPREGALVGDNTDGAGFLIALQDELAVEAADLHAVILGAGGAARAVAMSLARAGAGALILANRTRERAERLAREVNGLGMLLHQGAFAFERWTGRPAPLAAMREALRG
jgi:shikimate dehydrogenase